MTDTRAYSKEFLSELIILYRSVPCLWRVKSKEYLDRNNKDKAWDTIMTKFREVDPEIDKGSAIKKMNSLKTSWRRENKVRESMRSGAAADDVYVPKLWYFDLINFTEEEETPRESITNMDENEDDIVDDGGTERDISINEGTDTTTPFSTTSTPSTSSSPAPGIPGKKLPSKKRVLDQSAEVLSLIKEKFSKPQENQCRFDILGKNRAEKLKVLPDEQRIFAEKLVNDVLFEAELGTLNRHGFISVPAPYPAAQEPTLNMSFWQG